VGGPAGRGGFGSKGYRTFLHARGGKIVVPAYCWKVILSVPAGTSDPRRVSAGQAEVVAVIIPNVQGHERDWRSYAVTVRDVEELTGFTFFSRLPPEVAKKLKSSKREAQQTQTLAGFRKGCVIGNRRSRKYHVPGGQGYEKNKQSPNAVFFPNAQEAEKAGYTRAKR
jgi:endonuclease G